MTDQQIVFHIRGTQRVENVGTSIVPDSESATVRIVWEFWRAGYERSYHGEPGTVDLGEIS